MFDRFKIADKSAVETLIHINILLYISSWIFSSMLFRGSEILPQFCCWPFKSDNFQPFQLITYQFFHANIKHIFFNMLALWSFGSLIEGFLGKKKFYIYYLICGVIGAVFHLLFSNSSGVLIGASGSIFGILTLFGLIYPNKKLKIIFLPIYFEAKWFVGSILLIELVSIFFNLDTGVSHLCHIGGSFAALVIFLTLKSKNNDRNQI